MPAAAAAPTARPSPAQPAARPAQATPQPNTPPPPATPKPTAPLPVAKLAPSDSKSGLVRPAQFVAPQAQVAQGSPSQATSDSNALNVVCPGCGNVTLGNTSIIGRRVRCKQCAREFQVSGGSRPAIDFGSGQPGNLLGGIHVESEAARPLAAAPALHRTVTLNRKPRVSLDDDDDEYSYDRSSGVDTFDQVLSILGLLWALAMVGMVGLSFYSAGPLAGLGSMVIAFAIPHFILYLIALVRIAHFGSAGTAVLCFFGTFICGIGEIVALVLSNSNSRKWRLDGILAGWTTFFVMTWVSCFALYGYAAYLGAQIQQASQQHRHPSGRDQQTVEQRAEPAGPPTPIIAPPNQDAFFAKLERRIANREALERLLSSIKDAHTAEAVAPKYKELQSEYDSMEIPTTPSDMSPDQHRRHGDYVRRDADKIGRIAQEEVRVRRIPGAAEPLGLTPLEAPPDTRPTHPRERPKPTTPEETIKYALEDLNGGDVFRRREAVKTLRSVEVDDSQREDVSKALQIVITDSDHFLKEDAAAALAKWATRKNIPALIEMLGTDRHSHGDARKHAIRALAQFKDDKCARAIGKMLFTDDWQIAVEALKEMGPVAEVAALPQIDNDDPKMRYQVCGILEEVGTTRSLDDLKRHANGDRVKEVKQAAKDAIKAIEARNGKSSKK